MHQRRSHVDAVFWSVTCPAIVNLLPVFINSIFLAAMNMKLFGDQSHKMHNGVGVYISDGVAGEAVRGSMLNDFIAQTGYKMRRHKYWNLIRSKNSTTILWSEKNPRQAGAFSSP